MVGKVIGELRDIEAQRPRVPDQVIVLERLLVLQQQVVHFPEHALRPGRLRRLLDMGKGRGQREMAKGEAQPAAKRLAGT